MASYEETYNATESPGGGSLLLSMAPWLVAGHFHGMEKKMAKGITSKAFAGGYGGSIVSNKLRTPGKFFAKRFAEQKAVGIAGKHGVFKTTAWTAAKKAGLTGQLARVAASRVAGLAFSAFNVYMFAPMVYSGVRGAVNSLREIGKKAKRLEFGGDYVDTRGAYTERQRALRAITSSRMSTRSALGMEAMLMHR